MKDPAFLFYAKDFYEGTRMMLPEERACYIDLLIYQHQNGFIPNDLKRVLMYCSGVDEATLIATLKAKFVLSEQGWYNLVLKRIIEERTNFKTGQSENGVLGQFYKKSKRQLNTKQYNELRDYVTNVFGKDKLIIELKKEETTHEAMLEALLKHIAIANEDVIENENRKKGAGKKPKPELELTMPFDSETFHAQWQLWKTYKHKQHGFKYKTVVTEQAALKELAELADTEEKAIKIIHQSIAQGWKGLFELKNETKNGNNTTNPFERANDLVDKFYSANRK